MQRDFGPQKQTKPKVFRPEPVQYDDGLETNLYGIAEQICSRPPQPPCTIHLIMDHDIPTQSDLDDFEFDLLRTFTMACLKILFGENVNPVKLAEKDMEKLQQYINSIGYTMITETEDTDISTKFTVSFRRYGAPDPNQPNPLESLKKYMHQSKYEHSNSSETSSE